MEVSSSIPIVSYWNYRLVKFPLDNEGQWEIRLCEVYYNKEVPHSYAEALTPIVDDIDCENRSEQDAINAAYLWYVSKILEASQKPVIPVEYFEK